MCTFQINKNQISLTYSCAGTIWKSSTVTLNIYFQVEALFSLIMHQIRMFVGYGIANFTYRRDTDIHVDKLWNVCEGNLNWNHFQTFNRVLRELTSTKRSKLICQDYLNLYWQYRWRQNLINHVLTIMKHT